MKTPKRLKNYFFTRERNANEVEWCRANALQADMLMRPVVLVTGVFDLLHVGHMRMLFAAREKAEGGTLVVAMNSDRMVQEMKGESRPIMSWCERAATLGYMPVDVLVEVDSDVELRDLTNRIRPDIKVMGMDHFPASASKYPWMRKMFVRAGGMRTSEIIQRVLDRQKEDE